MVAGSRVHWSVPVLRAGRRAFTLGRGSAVRQGSWALSGVESLFSFLELWSPPDVSVCD